MSIEFASILQHADPFEQQPLLFQMPRTDSKPSLQCYLWRSNAEQTTHLIIFTHGAGGTCLSPTAAKLCSGLSTSRLVVGFDGSSNLKARTIAFLQAIEWCAQAPQITTMTLCGRSMGGRAATIAYAQSSCSKLSGKLILQSYPLIGNGGDVRKQILLDLPDNAEVVFCQGGEDGMCPSNALNDVRCVMAARSTSCYVTGLDHGMSCTAKMSAVYSKVVVADMLHDEIISAIKQWLDASAGQIPHDMWLSFDEDHVIWTDQPSAGPAASVKIVPTKDEASEAQQPARRMPRAQAAKRRSIDQPNEEAEKGYETPLRRSKRPRSDVCK